jgi:tetratricopeptide (TPR) repeat protein
MLAHHYAGALEYAQATGEVAEDLVERARLALRHAGDRALALGAWPATNRFYTAALELWPADDPGLPWLRFQCGRARFNAEGTGLDMVQGGVEELEAAGETEAAAEAAVIAARIVWNLGDTEQHDRYVKRALALVGDRRDSSAWVAAMGAVAAKQMFDGHLARSIESANKALPVAERLGLGDDRVRLLNLRGNGRCSLGDYGGFGDFEQAIALAEEIHAYEHLHSAFNNLMTRQVALGQLDEAWETLAAMKRNFERSPTKARKRWLHNIEAELGFVKGSWQRSTELVDEMVAESDAGSPHYLDGPTRIVRASIRLVSGDRSGASEDTEKALEWARRSGEGQLLAVALLARAEVLLEAGRSVEASVLADEALEFGDRLVLLANDLAMVDAAWLMLDLGRAQAYSVLLSDAVEVPWVEAAAAVCAGEFLRAADVLAEIGYRPGEAYARLRAAKQLVEDGRRAEADVELQRALAFWREVGATRYVREGEALLAASA